MQTCTVPTDAQRPPGAKQTGYTTSLVNPQAYAQKH